MSPKQPRENYKIIATQKPSKADRKTKIKGNLGLVALLEMSDAEMQTYVTSTSKADKGTRDLLVMLIQAVRILLEENGLD